MRIVCSKCATEYDIDLPRTALDGRHRSLKFRCSNCGHIFNTSVEPASPAPTAASSEAVADASPARPAQPPPGTKGMLVKQEGKIYNVRDLATLQRWVIERRVTRDDLVSFGGTAWEAATTRPELESFFEIVEKADHVNGGTPPDSGADPHPSGPVPRVAWDKTDAGTERPELPLQAPADSPPALPPAPQHVLAAPAPVAPVVQAAAPTAPEEPAEVLGALEAEDEDMDATGEEVGEDTHEDEASAAAHLRDDMSPALSSPAREEKGGIPAFPMGGGLSARPEDPLAMGTSIVRGQTGRDQVFDAFSMDEVGETAPRVPVAPAAPVAPVAPMASVSAARLREPGPALRADAPTPLPITGPVPIAATLPVNGPAIMAAPPVPTPAPLAVPQGPARRSRELDWDEAGPRRPGVNWSQVGVVALAALAVGLAVKIYILPAQTIPPVVTVAPPPAPAKPAVAEPAKPAVAEPAKPAVAEPAAPVPSPAPEAAPPAPAPADAVKPALTARATAKAAVAPGSKGAVRQGWAAMEKGDFGKARQLCMDVAADSPSNGDAQYCVAQAAQKQGDLSTAVDRYCRALSGTISDADSREIRGILSSLGRSCN